VLQGPPGIEGLIEIGVESPDIDAEILQQVARDTIPLVFRRVDRLRAAVPDDELPVDAKFIAFCVAAKIVVRIENQDSSIGPAFLIKVGACQTADPAAHDDQIVVLLDGRPGEVERCPIAQAMRGLE